MRFDHLKSLYLSAVVMVLCLAAGLLLSQRKLLWLDELYTQQTAIEANSYKGILSFRFPDGNKHPLFYLVQKMTGDVLSYHLPVHFDKNFYTTRDVPSQVVLRIPSNFYMSLSLGLIFYFFTRFYSIFAAFYALAVALASPMVWMYWAEARPYSLWFLLTTIQLLLLCCMSVAPRINTGLKLFLTHILLAFTTPASVFQITIAAFIAWRKTRVNIKQLALIWALPMAIDSFYCFFDAATKIRTYMFFTNLFDAIMPERLFVYIIYAAVGWGLPAKYKKISWNIFFLPIFLCYLASGLFLLISGLFVPISVSISGFFSRYLIYLMPADILMYCLVSIDLRRWSRPYPWICMNVSIFLGGLVLIRALMTYRIIVALALYLHSP